MSIFKRQHKGGMADVIRCDEKDYLIWKWHPDKYEEGKLKRETAIRTNSVLRVKTGEVAVFVYKQKNGDMEDYIVGPYDETLKTKNFPVLSSIIGLWYEGDTPFQAEVFFINLAKDIQIKFAVPYFDVVDPRFPDFTVPTAVRGTMTFKIEDYKEFTKIHQLATFNYETLKEQVTDSIVRLVKNVVANAPTEANIPLVGIETQIDVINQKAEAKVKERMAELFGISTLGVDISAIDVDKTSAGYLELKKITKDLTTRKAEADITNYEETLRIQREEAQYAQRMGTRTANIGAYETEIKGQVGVAGAEALGKMGQNGAANVNLGGGGFNPMNIVAGLAVGSAFAKNLGGAVEESLNPNASVPPSLPKTNYFIAKDNNPVGPFELNKVVEMINNGELNRESLVWKQGTPTWEKAESFAEFAKLFPPKL